jgi:hypothetical protein
MYSRIRLVPLAGYCLFMYLLLWLIAVALVIAGIVMIVRGSWVLGIVLIIVGLLVGPGGVSIFDFDDGDDDLDGAPAVQLLE